MGMTSVGWGIGDKKAAGNGVGTGRSSVAWGEKGDKFLCLGLGGGVTLYFRDPWAPTRAPQ